MKRIVISLFKLVLFLIGLFYVYYINDLLKTAMVGIHRLFICVGLIYAIYITVTQIEAALVRYYERKTRRN